MGLPRDPISKRPREKALNAVQAAPVAGKSGGEARRLAIHDVIAAKKIFHLAARAMETELADATEPALFEALQMAHNRLEYETCNRTQFADLLKVRIRGPTAYKLTRSR